MGVMMSSTCREEKCCPPANAYAADASPCQNDDPICAQYPAVCLTETRLILKPSSAVVEVLGEVRYQAFLFMDGHEMAITGNVLYSVSNSSIALIGGHSGNAIGVSAGSVTITADYGGLQAFATLQVIDSGACSLRSASYLLLFDISKSSTAGFLGSYPLRLEAAKAFGTSFVNRTNLVKDAIAVMEFDTTATAVQSFSHDAAVLDAAITSLASTQNNTDLALALQSAASYFTSQSITTNRIVVLFTDGEDNTGDDPTVAAQALRDSGIVLIIVGLRAKQGAFNLLSNMVSAGFFINALPSNLADVDDLLNGLKSYLCSGDCTPTGGNTVGTGQLNFTNFINWDVIENHVDLIGGNIGAIPFYDFLPGNGDYVDGCGSTASVPGGDKGAIRLKNVLAVTVGHNVETVVTIAGNQRENRTPDVTEVVVVDQTGNTIASNQFSITDYTQDFIAYALNVVIGAGVTGIKVIVRQKAIAAGSGVYGNLWGEVTVTDTTVSDGLVLFHDNFDADNPTLIPLCASGYSYGHCHNYGCLDTPIPQQLPDADELPDLESIPNTGGSNVLCADEAVQVYARTFAIIGDYGDAGVGALAVANLVASWKPDYAISNGDNWYGSLVTNSECELLATAPYKFLIYPYHTYQSPPIVGTALRNNLYVVIGNHDDDPVGRQAIELVNFNVPPVFKSGVWLNRPYYNVLRGLAEHFFYHAGYNNTQYLIEPDGNDVGSDQWNWLISAATKSTARWKTLHIHHPGHTSTLTSVEGAGPAGTLVGDGYLNYTAIRNVVEKLANDYRGLFDLVTFGHCHNYERLIFNGLPLIINGAGGHGTIGFGAPRSWSLVRFSSAFGAQKMSISYRTLRSQFIDVTGVIRDDFSLSK